MSSRRPYRSRDTSCSTGSRPSSRRTTSSRWPRPPFRRASRSKMATTRATHRGFAAGSAAEGLSRQPRNRLAPEIFDLPVEKMRAGYYTDAYFNHARATLLADGRQPRVVVQVFQKNEAWLGGVDEAIAILRLCSHEPDGLTIRALHDGDRG